MLLFRSEEHVVRWREHASPPASTVLSLDQAAALANGWYRNKLAPDWRRRTADEAQTLFADLRLDAAFWRLR